jgi:hypothetical protein
LHIRAATASVTVWAVRHASLIIIRARNQVSRKEDSDSVLSQREKHKNTKQTMQRQAKTKPTEFGCGIADTWNTRTRVSDLTWYSCRVLLKSMLNMPRARRTRSLLTVFFAAVVVTAAHLCCPFVFGSLDCL